MTPRVLPYVIPLLLAAVLAAGASFAQDLGSAAAAVGAVNAMETNPMKGGQQQINRAAGIANSPAPAAAKPVTPAAAATASTAPAAASPVAAAAAAAAPATAAPAAAAPEAMPKPGPAEAAVDVHAPFRQSFFFTSEDIISIKKALEQQKVAPVSQVAAAAQTIPPIRRIVLSGVVYKAANDWLVWINGQKVTPTVSMKEIVDIKVEREQVHLKWFDIGANYVIDITMRPNETYDIPTGVLIPGMIK